MNALFPVNDGLITCDNRLFDKSVSQNKIFLVGCFILKQHQGFPPDSTDKAFCYFDSIMELGQLGKSKVVQYTENHTILNSGTLVVFLRDRREISGNFHLTRVLGQWLPSVTAIRQAKLAPDDFRLPFKTCHYVLIVHKTAVLLRYCRKM